MLLCRYEIQGIEYIRGCVKMKLFGCADNIVFTSSLIKNWRPEIESNPVLRIATKGDSDW